MKLWPTYRKKFLTEAIPEEAQTLELLAKDIKSTILRAHWDKGNQGKRTKGNPKTIYEISTSVKRQKLWKWTKQILELQNTAKEIKNSLQGLGTSPAVQWLRCHHPVQGAQVQFLVGELRSHISPGQKPNTLKKKEKQAIR